jgi:Cu/Ag efflux pump CusA
MLKNLIAFSLKQSTLVIFIAAALLVYTLARLPKMSVDVFPELNAPTVVILTEAGGLAADEVEQYVTFPLESAVNGLPGVRRRRSRSRSCGLSLSGGRTSTAPGNWWARRWPGPRGVCRRAWSR